MVSGPTSLSLTLAHLHRDLQHHHHPIKAVNTARMARPSKRQLVGHSNQLKKVRIAVERELEAQAILQSGGATGPPSESDEEGDLEISDSENESDVKLLPV